ncbi:hypothetical protein GGG16DRAFT_102784 [Schizophyllum commune]
MSSDNGTDSAGNFPPPNPSNHPPRPVKLQPHFERMLPYLQVNMHTNKFHTEHEDYIFTLPALTSMVESHMDRPAIVAAQPKIWRDDAPAQPEKQAETGVPNDEQPPADSQIDVDATRTPEPQASSESVNENPEIRSSTTLPGSGDRTKLGTTGGELAWIPEGTRANAESSGRWGQIKGAGVNNMYDDPEDALDFPELAQDDGSPFAHEPGAEAAAAPAAAFSEALMKQVQQLLNTSVSSNRTNTANADLVIADYMVMALEDPNMKLDQELVNATAAAVREKEARLGNDYYGHPENYTPRYRADIPDDDSDDDEKKKKKESEDPAYQPSGPRKSTTRDPYHIRKDPPQVQRTPQHQPTTEDLDLSDVGGYALEKPDWLDQDRLEAGMDESEPGDEICNTEAAFKRLKHLAKFIVAMLIECKQSVSRQEEGQVYGDTKFTRLREAQRQLMKQASYLLTSDTWGKRQDRVVAMAMIGDWWSWSEFEKRIGYKKQANWDDYTYETRPIKTSRPWSQLVQWGSPASDRAMQKMMQRVNELFPGAGVALPPTLPSTSPSHPGSPEGPDGEVPLPEAPDSADPNAPSKNRVQLEALDPMSADYWDGADPGDDDEARSGDDEDHGEDDADSPEGAGEVLSSGREVSYHDDEDQHAPVVAATSDPEARSLDRDVTMDEPKRTPSGSASSGAIPVSRAPASHLSWRDLQRYNSEDSLKADDTQLPLIARADAVAADGSVTRRLHGEKTQATFDVFSNMRLGDGTGHGGATSTEPPDGKSTQEHAQDVTTLPAPNRISGDSPGRTQATSGSNRQRDMASDHSHSIDGTVNTSERGSFETSSAPDGAPAASVASLGPRMQYRQLLRTDTQDTELTPESGHLAHPAGDDGNDANKEPTDRTGGTALTGHATQATLDALAAISISPNENAGPSASAPMGGNGPVDASIAAATAATAQGGSGGDGGGGSGGATGGHVPINPDNPLKRSAPDDSDDEEHAGDAHVSKKAKRAPANTEPSAQAGSGPSTQAARGQAASTRGKRKMLVMPPSTPNNWPDSRPLRALRLCHPSVAFAHPTPSKAARYISSSSPRQFDDLNNDTLVNLVSLHHYEAARRLHDHLVASGITIQPHPIYVDAALAALDRPSHTERINLFSTWFRLIPDAHVSLLPSSPSDDASTSTTVSKEASRTSQVVDLRPIHNALLHTGTPANNLPLISRFAALAAEKGYTIPQLASATGDSAQVAHARIWPDILALLISHAPPALATKIMVEHEFAVGAYVARMGNAHAPAERARLREQSVRACLDAARLRGDAKGVGSKGSQADVKGKRTDWLTADAGWLDAAAALLRTADGLKLDRRLFDIVIDVHILRGASDTSSGSSNASLGFANDSPSTTTTITALRTARAAHGRKPRTETRLALPGDLPMQLREVRAALRERVLHTYLDVNDFLVRLCRERSSSGPRTSTSARNGASSPPESRASSSPITIPAHSRLLALLRRRALAHSDATALTWLVAELYLCRNMMDGRRALGIFLENFTMEGFSEEARGLIEEVAGVHGIQKDDAKGEDEVESDKQMFEGCKRPLPPPFIPGADPALPDASTPGPSPQTSTAAASPTTAALPTPIALPPHYHWLIWHALTLLAWKHPPRLRRLLDAYEASVVSSEAETHDGASQAVVRAHSSEALAAGGARQVLLGFMSGFARHGIARTGSAMLSGRGRGQGGSSDQSTSLADLRRVWRLMERMQIIPRRAHYEILAKRVALAGEGSERGGAPSQSAHDPPLSVGVSAALDILEHIPHPESYAAVIDALLDRGMVGAGWKVREAMEGRFGKDAMGGRSPRLRATMTRLERMTEEKVASFAVQRKRHTGGMKAKAKAGFGRPPANAVNKPLP